MATESNEQSSRCPNCGSPVREQALFCATCGQQLAASDPDDVITDNLYPGATLANERYSIQRQLGQGGGGAVYLAEDRNLARQVVVKELHTYFKSTDERRRAENDFRREALILARLSADHPNLPQAFDHFTEGNRHYMVMQFITGENLEQRLRRLGKLDEKEVLLYAATIADILVFIHSQKPEPVVHRDLKPANIIVDNQSRVKLVDFGLAKAMGHHPTGGLNSQHLSGVLNPAQPDGDSNAAGTAGYTAMEQWQGRAEPASDIYALGATMHHLLTARDPRDPFNAYPELNLDIVRRLSQFIPLDSPTLKAEGVRVTPATKALIEAMLDPAPARRPTGPLVKSEVERILTALNQNAPTAADLLGRTAAGQPQVARPPQPQQPQRSTTADRLLQRTYPPARDGGNGNNGGNAGYAGPRLDRISANRQPSGGNAPDPIVRDLLGHSQRREQPAPAQRPDLPPNVLPYSEMLNPPRYQLNNQPAPTLDGPLVASRAFRFSAAAAVSYALQEWLREQIKFMPVSEPLDVHVQGLTFQPLYLISYMIDAPLPQINHVVRRQGTIILDAATEQALTEAMADLWLPEWRGLNTPSAPASNSTPPSAAPQLLTLRDLPPAYGAPPRPPQYPRSELQLQQRARQILAEANSHSVVLESIRARQTFKPEERDIHLTFTEAVYGALWHAGILLRGKSYTLSAFEGSRAGTRRGQPNFLLRETSLPGRAFCTICGLLYQPEQVVQCENCGKPVCSKDKLVSGVVRRRTFCSPTCAAQGGR